MLRTFTRVWCACVCNFFGRATCDCNFTHIANFIVIFMTFCCFFLLVYFYIFEFQANGKRQFQFLPKPSKSMQPQPCLLLKEANVSWNCPSQMLVFVIVLELSKLIRIMPLLINSEEEPTGKLFFFKKSREIAGGWAACICDYSSSYRN